MKNTDGYCRTMAIKGKRENIMNAFREIGWSVHIHNEMMSEQGITTMHLELEDPYIDTTSFELLRYNNLKFIILVKPEESYTDVIVFKDFGSDKIVINNAYTYEYGSLYAEELEGTIFFPDEEFKISYEDYSCGEMATLEYNFSVKELWENDSTFVCND